MDRVVAEHLGDPEQVDIGLLERAGLLLGEEAAGLVYPGQGCLPLRPSGPRFALPRSDFGASFADPSELGGLLEFLDDIRNRASSSSIRATADVSCAARPATPVLNSAFCAANCSYEGCGATSGSDTARSKHAATHTTPTHADLLTQPRALLTHGETYPVTIDLRLICPPATRGSRALISVDA
jgi:hypothetical protein